MAAKKTATDTDKTHTIKVVATPDEYRTLRQAMVDDGDRSPGAYLLRAGLAAAKAK